MLDKYLQAAIDANNGKAIIFLQTFGIGDILFCEPIARKYHNEGYVVIWPVNPEFFWVSNYISYVHFRTVADIKMDYEQCNDDYKFEGIPVLPLRFSNPLLRGLAPHDGSDRNHWMNDKYERLGLPVDMWKSLQWTRNEEKENELYKLLGLKENSKYVFGNTFFGGWFADAGIFDMAYYPDADSTKEENSSEYETIVLPVVQMRKIDGFTMLDWAKVICNATEIHTVETSVLYMIESLPVKATSWHLYPRRPETTLDQVKNIISLDKWILHESE